MEQQINSVLSVNDYVSYGRNGIYQITDIRSESFGGENRRYYILKSVYDRFSQVYVPADSPELAGRLRGLLDAEEIGEAINAAESSCLRWVEDSKLRAAEFERIISGGDRAEILWIVKMLSQHKTEVESRRKKFYASDERALETALKIITEEFAFALGLSKEEVVPYIKERVK